MTLHTLQYPRCAKYRDSSAAQLVHTRKQNETNKNTRTLRAGDYPAFKLFLKPFFKYYYPAFKLFFKTLFNLL